MTWLLGFLVIGLAGFLTGMTGFGFSVLSAPLLLLLYPPHQVVVMVLLLVPLTSALLLLAPHLRGILDTRLCLSLTGLSVIGLPVGLLVFHALDPELVSALIGGALVAFSIASLVSAGKRGWLGRRWWIVPSGILGGILATSTGLSGPAVAMYVHKRQLTNGTQVATMAAYVGLVSVLGVVLLAVRGEVASTALTHAGEFAPGALAGVTLGRWWARRQRDVIDKVTLVCLGLMGLWTIARAVLTWLTHGGIA